jgi:hypothetical protein
MSASRLEFGKEPYRRLHEQFSTTRLQRAGGRLVVPFLEGPARGAVTLDIIRQSSARSP